MVWQYNPYSAFLFLTAASQVFLALFARQQVRNRVTTLFTLVTMAGVWWVVGYGLEIAAVGLPAKLFWARVSFSGLMALVYIWTVLVVVYAGPYRWLSPGRLALLAAVPAAAIALAWSNDLHGWLWSGAALSADGQFLILATGPALWGLGLASFALVGATVWLLLRVVVRSDPATFRWQGGAMLAAAILPWAAGAAGAVNLGPWPYLQLAPFALALSAFALYLGLKRYFLLDVAPIARTDVIDSLDDAVIVVDAAGRVLNANKSAERLLQRSAVAMIGLPIREVLAGDVPLPAATLEPNAQPLAAGVREIRLDNTDGSRVFQQRLLVFTDRDRVELGYLIVLSDISSRKRAQQLRQDLTRAIVHDLRSPVSNLALTLDWFEGYMGEQLGDAETELLQSAQLTARKLLNLVSSILDLERLESGEMPLHREELDLGKLVDLALGQQAVLAQMQQFRLIGDLPEDLPAAFGDKGLVERVLQNLVSNATKFSPPGSTVRVSAHPSGDHLLVTVEDDGPGISREAAAHLFEKYKPGYQAGHGSGLGLAFCKQALEAHGERIWAEGRNGGGTRICFTLARVDVAVPRSHHSTTTTF